MRKAGLLGNAVLGLAAGAAGVLAMDGFWAISARLKKQQGSKAEGEAPTTERVAVDLMRRVWVRELSPNVRRMGGQVVHWTYGTMWGGVFGLSEAAGIPLGFGAGVPFGAGLWALGDLWMLYQLGYAKHPREYPTSVHTGALAAHLCYGAGVWGAWHGLRALARAATGSTPERLRPFQPEKMERGFWRHQREGERGVHEHGRRRRAA